MPSFHNLIAMALLITNSQKTRIGVVRSRFIWALGVDSPPEAAGGLG